MKRAAAALAVVAGWSLACARSGGPKPEETTLWQIDAPAVSAQGCDDARPMVDAVAESYADGLGIGWRVQPSGTSAQLLTCDESGAAISIDDCLPDGELGTVTGNSITWNEALVLFDQPGCELVAETALTVTDSGMDGALRAVVRFTGAEDPRCTYEADGVPVRPQGCAVSVDADLLLVDVQ